MPVSMLQNVKKDVQVLPTRAPTTSSPLIFILGLLSVAPIVIYSLRLMRAAYTGFCIRVRRSSDNTLRNIGFVNGVLGIAELLAFVGGGDGFIETKYDQSVNGRNQTQTVNANQPRIVNAGVLQLHNGKPTAHFLSNNTSFMSSGLLTAFNVGHLQAVAAYLNAGFNQFDGLITANNLFLAGSNNNTTELSNFGITTSFVNGVSTRTLSMNGILDVIAGTLSNNSATEIFLGIDRGIAGRNWRGSISETLAFSAPLSTADRQLLEADQKAYYKTP